ncbi:MAG TPA: hypothetical protein VNA17_11820 [Pyrinomonadaceae bacterium]|nr:hypothetical protein [Pyrinomonadaceae bacterium]
MLIILVTSYYLAAQAVEWRAYTPADESFSIEIPRLPVERILPSDPKSEDPLEKGVTGWRVRPPGDDDFRYSILRIEFDAMRDAFKKEGMSERELIDYLAIMIAGDDDAPRFLSKGKGVRNHGVSGTEYTFIFDDTANKGALRLYTRSRFFVREKILFVIKFHGHDASDLSSADAIRFLISFKILEPKKVPKKDS